MPAISQVIEADLAWVNGEFAPGVRIAVDDAGRIRSIDCCGPAPTRRLTGRALLPGFVSAHSHAFQRGLRGLGEHFPAGAGDFWSWREEMYRLVQRVRRAELHQSCRACFDEMLAAGYTTVGEFHYLHHEDPQQQDFAFDDVVLAAAREAGIRIVLLMSYYKTGGVGRPLEPGQRRFSTPDVNAFLQHCDHLAAQLDSRTQSIGLAPHSLRAVPPQDMLHLHREAKARGWVCHVHVEEQRKEVEEVEAALGVEPMRWLLDRLDIGPEFTAIHATHARAARLDEFLRRGARICVCPITEGNLGDGFCDLPAIGRHAGQLCIGTDSNIRLDPAEELRWLEFVQRLRLEKRGVFRGPAGELATRLLACATANGAAALNLPSGSIEPGRLADFVAIDPNDPSLRGVGPDDLLAAFILGSGSAAVREVCVGGSWRVVR